MSQTVKILTLLDELRQIKQNADYWNTLLENNTFKLNKIVTTIVMEALLKCCDCTWDAIISPKRTTDLFHCRIIFAYHCHVFGLDNRVVCSALHRDRVTTMHYPFEYRQCIDPDFILLSRKVSDLLR